MKIFYVNTHESQETQEKPCVVTLGNFDAIHLGHLSLINETKKIATQKNALSAVATFDPHPRGFTENKITKLLIPYREKIDLLKNTGIDLLFQICFNHALMSMSPQEFIKTILKEQINANHIVIGENFFFGKNRSGTSQTLKSESHKLGIDVSILPLVSDNKKNISTSAIKEKIMSCDFHEAEQMLGRHFYMELPILKEALDANGSNLSLDTSSSFLKKGYYKATISFDGTHYYDGLIKIDNHQKSHITFVEKNVSISQKYNTIKLRILEKVT